MTFNAEDYIINRSSRVKGWMRARDVLLTVTLWGFYLYLMRDFFAFLLHTGRWAALEITNTIVGCGGDCVGITLIHPNVEIVYTMLVYAEIIAFMGAALMTWALYNQLRYGGKTRRKQPHAVSVHELANLYRSQDGIVDTWQRARILIMHHNEQGRLTAVDVKKQGGMATVLSMFEGAQIA